jgi:hypothetical protein
MAARTEQREFFVWVNPDDFMAKHNIGVVGGIGQEPPPQDFSPKDLLFIHNPNHKVGFVAPFHRGVIQDYGIEYDLERFRYENHRELPSRLFALYLFENRAEASKYHAQHPAHVGRRVLKRGITEGPYIYTVHDSAWIDFLRLPHSIDADTFNFCWRGYWSGARMEGHEFTSMGRPWKPISIMEALFYGRINFPNKDVHVFD